MKHWKLKHLALAALVAGSAVVLAGCEAQGDGSLDGISSDETFPNDGSTPTLVTEGGVPINVGERFICDRGASNVSNDVDTAVATLGLVGGTVNDLLALIGAIPVAGLLDSIREKDLVVDSDLSTFARFTRVIDLASALSTVDEVVLFNKQVSSDYLVFGLSFPDGALELSLLDQVVVRTFLGNVQQEVTVLSQAAVVDLLGVSVVPGFRRVFFGLKPTTDFDAVSVGLAPTLGVNVGTALRVHELCTDGHFVAP